ncbi:MAG: phosphatase [Actinomycetota bacterium]|nr:phosphatase [Actinomycetota bacterium]
MTSYLGATRSDRSAPDLAQTADALVAAGITGPHQSHSRHNNISKINAMLEGIGDTFGLGGLDKYSATEVLGFLAELTGCSADVEDDCEFDTIDPQRTVAGIVVAAQRLREEAVRGASLLVGTGHPTGMLEHHIRVVDAYRGAGGKVSLLREDETIPSLRKKHLEVRYTGGVACLADWGNLRHTHSAEPMEWLLEAEPWPDVVLGDHGFAGAAIERGIPTIAVMDINDPALAVASAEGRDVVIVPMDDNRPPRLYEPSWTIFEHVLAGGEL